MEFEKDNSKLSRVDRILISAAIALFLLSLPFYFNDNLFNILFHIGGTHSTQPVVGEIVSGRNDFRHRDSENMNWGKAVEKGSIRLNDAVFTGDNSSLLVKLNSGGDIQMSEKSLIIFSQIGSDRYANIKNGVFKLDVHGKMKIALNGKITEIESTGANSTIQLSVGADKMPVFKVLKGDAKLNLNGRQLALNQDTTVDLVKAEKAISPSILARTVVGHDIKEYYYEDKVADWYQEVSKDVYSPRAAHAPQVSMNAILHWKNEGPVTRAYGEVSDQPDFSKAIAFEMMGTNFNLEKLWVGANYWRVSPNKTDWSATQFQVITRLILNPPPVLEFKNPSQLMLSKAIRAELKILSPSGFSTYLVEISESSEFKPDQTQAFLITNKALEIPLAHGGSFYYRTRGVTPSLQISAFSDTKSVNVNHPDTPSIPSLTNNMLHGIVDVPLLVEWKPTAEAIRYHAVMYDQQGHIVSKNSFTNHNFNFKAPKAGKYTYALTAVDKWGQRSAKIQGHIQIDPKPAPPATVAANPPPERKPASHMSNELKVEDPTASYRNQKYSSSTLEIEGGGFAMYSSEEVAQTGVNTPLSMIVTAKIRHWFSATSSNGVEASAMTKVLNLNTAGAVNSPIDMEALYLHRWKFGWNPFFSFKQMSISTRLGYELYSNTGGGIYSPHYSMLKGGIGFSFPAFQRWDTGGELTYGRSFGSDTKYEVSGHVHYFFKPNWSMGAGYKVFLFEAGNVSSSPNGLPYREGYGEGYSVMRYHY